MIIHQLRRLLRRTRKPVKVINVLGNVHSWHRATHDNTKGHLWAKSRLS